VVTEDAVSVDVSVDEPTDESLDADTETAEDAIEGASITSESVEDTELADDTTVEADTGDVDEDVDPVADGLVQCLVCGEYYQAITEPHLQTHDMTIQDYRDEYGEDVPLRPDDDE